MCRRWYTSDLHGVNFENCFFRATTCHLQIDNVLVRTPHNILSFTAQNTTCCNTRSNAPDDGRKRPKHVEPKEHQQHYLVASSWIFTNCLLYGVVTDNFVQLCCRGLLSWRKTSVLSDCTQEVTACFTSVFAANTLPARFLLVVQWYENRWVLCRDPREGASYPPGCSSVTSHISCWQHETQWFLSPWAP
jgi:hypothetical protein